MFLTIMYSINSTFANGLSCSKASNCSKRSSYFDNVPAFSAALISALVIEYSLIGTISQTVNNTSSTAGNLNRTSGKTGEVDVMYWDEVGNGMKCVLMEVKDEYYLEDKKAAERNILESELSMDAKLKSTEIAEAGDVHHMNKEITTVAPV